MRRVHPPRCLATALVLAIGGCGSTPAPPARPAHGAPVLRVGLVVNSLGFGRRGAAKQDAAKQAGAHWLREELSWKLVEPTPGTRRWGAVDRLFASATRRRLRLLPLLSDSPPWALPRAGGLPIATAAYAAFVHDVVARYGPAGSFWPAHPRLARRLAPRWFELWNEPYLVAPGDTDAVRYAALAHAALAAARPADPAARFLLAADTGGAGNPRAAEHWLTALTEAQPGLLHEVDGIAAHPYGVVDPDGFTPLDGLIAALHERGARLPVWITEVGWSTCVADASCVTEPRQAADLATLLTALRSRYAGTVHAVFIYHLLSWVVARRGGNEGNFGLLRVDGSRKPAWEVYRRFALGRPTGAG